MKADEKKVPTGYICTKCKAKNPFGVYVAAHSTILLVHTCECGTKHKVLNYICRNARTGKSAETYS